MKSFLSSREKIVQHVNPYYVTPGEIAEAIVDDNDKAACEMINLVTRNHPALNKKNCNGDTPLHIAVRKNKQAITHLLLAKGADKTILNSLGAAPLHIAAVKKNYAMIADLCDDKIINHIDDRGASPLHIAAFNGDLNIAKMLLQYGADINLQGQEGHTALHFALFHDRLDVVRLLLAEWGADHQLTNDKGMTALMFAGPNRAYASLKLLLNSNNIFRIGELQSVKKSLHQSWTRKNDSPTENQIILKMLESREKDLKELRLKPHVNLRRKFAAFLNGSDNKNIVVDIPAPPIPLYPEIDLNDLSDQPRADSPRSFNSAYETWSATIFHRPNSEGLDDQNASPLEMQNARPS